MGELDNSKGYLYNNIGDSKMHELVNKVKDIS